MPISSRKGIIMIGFHNQLLDVLLLLLGILHCADLTENGNGKHREQMKISNGDSLFSMENILEMEPMQLSSSSRIIGPYFESNRTFTSATARAGQTILFDCAVVLLQGRTVSWLRRRKENLQLLTVGNQTYSSDGRLSLHFRYPNNWRLGISQVSKNDEGEYHCQLSTHPPKTLVFYLRVIAPAVLILDENEHVISERHYKVDSSLHLICRASQLAKGNELGYLNWYKEDRLLPGSDSRVKIKQWKNQTSGEASSFLSVLSMRKGDSGNYSCRASSTAQNTITVHVLNENLPAAVQHENSATCQFSHHHRVVWVSMFLSVAVAQVAHHFIIPISISVPNILVLFTNVIITSALTSTPLLLLLPISISILICIFGQKFFLV